MRGTVMAVCIAIGAAGCGGLSRYGDDEDTRTDPPVDGHPDTAVDVPVDGPGDVPVDGHPDTAVDVPVDGPGDVPVDGTFTCTPGEWGCFDDTHYQCAGDGVGRIHETPCPMACDPELGCVTCVPGSRRCEGDVSMVCTADGLGWVVGRDCSEWGVGCGAEGYCVDPCGEAEAERSYLGCEYWPVPLANTRELDEYTFDYRIVVANPNDAAATIEVERGGTDVALESVPARGLTEIALPWIEEQSFGIFDEDWDSLLVSDGAYRLTSSLPVAVSQFNPFEYSVDTELSYTNDASLLLPAHVLGGDYVGVTYVPFSRRDRHSGSPSSPSYFKYPDYIAVVGITSAPTAVEVQVSGQAAGTGGGGFWDTGDGGTIDLMLQQGQVAHIATPPPPDCDESRPGFVEESDCVLGTCSYLACCREEGYDLTGTRIRANHPVAVFGGHVCAYVPYHAQSCDHLEVQLPPVRTWGKEYVSMPMTDQGADTPNLVRVVAAEDDTSVTVSPPQDGVSTVMLDGNEWVEFFVHSAFTVVASRPVTVAQYLLGMHYPEPDAERGDPAMTVLVPQEQYRRDYTFIVPSSYNPGTNGQSYVMVVKPSAASLTLDSSPLSVTWSPAGAWQVGITPLAGGSHTLSGDVSFGVVVYGMGSFTSYAYPAGMDLARITGG